MLLNPAFLPAQSTPLAIFAGATNLPAGSKVIDMSSGHSTITGRIHCNSDIDVSGTANYFESGVVEYVTGIHPTPNFQGKVTLQNCPVVGSSVQTLPVTYQQSDFAPSGTAALAAQAAGEYYHIVGDTHLSAFISNGVLRKGLYYIEGNLDISVGSLRGQVTLVATKSITISGTGENWQPYSGCLLAFSTENLPYHNPAINISGGSSVWTGILYAPRAGVQISGTGNTINGGAIIGLGVQLTGGSLNITGTDFSACGAAPTNQPPVVNAGPDQSVNVHSNVVTVNLAGAATDDGLPAGGKLETLWTLVSGPGPVIFGDPTVTNTAVSLSVEGIYILRLTADDTALTNSDDVIITFDRPDNPPVANGQSVTNLEETTAAITMTGSDPDGDSLTFSIVTKPTFGVLSGTAPNVSYTPKAGYFGPDSFTFKVSDGLLESAPATVTITNLHVNHAPLAETQSVTTPEETSIDIALTGSDADGDGLTFTIVAGPTNGTYTVTGSTVTYTPASNYFGADAFSFIASDGVTNSSPALVDITVTPVDKPPLVDAGPDQLISLPQNVTQLAGSVIYEDFPDTVDSTVWTQLSGPGAATFADPSNAVTVVTFSQSGVYILQLVASDSFLSGTNQVQITVNAPPTVSAGPNQTNTLPDTITLSGSAADDGLPTNGTLTVAWSMVDGPGTVVFANPNGTNTTVAFSRSGIYTLRLTANDGAALGSNDVTVLANSTPIVDAGSDQVITNLQATLNGTAFDDGLPTTNLVTTWSEVSGPGAVSFSPASTTNVPPRTAATFSATGVYVLRLTADDSLTNSSSQVTISVDAAPTITVTNIPVINLGDIANFTATATDDGIPAGATLTYRWSQVSGPGTASFVDDSALATTASFSTSGVYVLQFQASDTLLTASSNVTVIVNQKPVVSAGTPQLVTYPQAATLNGSASDDGLPNNTLTYAWTQVSGPGTAIFADASSASTTVSFSASGVYVLQLLTSDSFAAASNSVTITVNNAPVAQNQSVTLVEDSSTNLMLLASDADGQSLSYSIVSQPSHGTLAGLGNQFSYTPGTNYFGSDTFTFKANDGYADSATATVTLTVLPQNDPPSFVAGANQSSLEDAGPQTIPNWATSISPGPANESAQTVHFLVSSDNPSLFSAGPSVASDGTLTYTAATNANGTATVTVRAQDDGGTANGGVDTSAPQTFSITVTAVNDAPRFSFPGSQTIGDAIALVFGTNRLISVSDVDAGQGVMQLSLGVGHGTLTLGSTNGLLMISGANGSSNLFVGGTLTDLNAALSNLTYTSALHYSGDETLTLSVNDQGNTGDGGPLGDFETVAITVVPTNHAPIFVSTPVTNATSIPLRSTQTFNRTPVDLTAWHILQYGPWGQGPANWSLSQSNLTATQAFNSDASILMSDVNMFWDRVEGDLLKFDTTDDDFIGFVFGYENSSNFYLFDWKQGTETIGVTAQAGMSVKVITADPQVVGSDALWATFEANPALAHTLYHNSIPYQTSVGYHFMLDFRPGDFTIQVSSGTNLLANIHLNDTSYPMGKFGFYNFSQAGVLYTGFNVQRIAADSYTYQAAASDVDGDTLTYSLVNGPTNMIVNATNGFIQWLPNTSFTGTVTVTIQVSDGHGGTALQTFPVFVPVPLINKPPFVNAGPDRAFAGISNAITLNGSIVDDGVPTNAPLTVSWSKLFGPGNVTFGNSNAPVTTAQFSTAGFYQLQLVGSDSLESSTDVVDIRADMLCTAPPPTNIVAWLPANLDARDVITGTTGIVQNVSYVFGEVGPGFGFTGTTNFVRLPAQPTYDVGTSASGFTIEFWSNPNSFFQNAGVMGWANGVRAERFTTSRTGDSLRFFVTGTNASNFIDAPGVWPGSTAVHMAITYDRSLGVASMYVNGILTTNVNVGTNVMSTTGDFYLGQVPGSAGYFGGILDEVSIYSRPLNAEEIYQIFAAGSSGKCPEDNNLAPIVFAGPDLYVRGVPGTTTLQGEVMDDGLPVNWQVHSHWSVFSGPGTVSFVDSNSPTTSATFSTNGVYVLQLTADDGEAQSSDLVEVRVEDFCTTDNPQGLVAWWPGNGIDQEAINGYDAIRVNGANFAAGKVASAFNFDGVNDYVRIPAQTNYDIGTSPTGFSLEFWLDSAGFQDGSVLGWANGVRAERFNSGGSGSVSGDSLRWYVGGTNSGQFLNSQRLWAGGGNNGRWVHLVLSYDRSTGNAVLYVNGLINATANVGTNLLSTAGDFYLQNVPGSAVHFFAGQLDEISLYSRPLSRVEAASLYVSGSMGKCVPDNELRPLVYAGPDITIASTNVAANLSGFVTDDGLPTGSVVTTRWQSLSYNPGAVTFGTSNSLTTTATFSTNGVYAIQLLADDGEKEGIDTVEVRVGVSCPALDIPGLVAWWPGNGNAVDKVSGIPAIPMGVDYTNGKVASSFNFHGTNDFIFVPARTNYDVGRSTNGMTLEFWTKGNFISGSDQGILSWNNGVSNTNGASNGVNMRQSGSSFSCDVREVSGVTHFVGAGPVFDGTWHHAAVTYDRVTGQLKAYVDGVLKSTVSAGSYQPLTSFDLTIGRALGFPAGNFNGQFDEIALYSRALTATEVQSIFNAGIAGKCITPSNMPPLVSAGPDKVISLPTNTVTLDGKVFDDNLPSNTLAIAWTYIAGDSSVFFSSTNTAAASVTFTNTGTYTFQLTVSDGQYSTNDTVTVTVLADLRARPTVAITAPEDQSLIQVPVGGATNLTITAAAADADGQVTNVQFFVNGTSVGTVSTAPYTITVPNLAPASYVLTAIATDNDGLSTTSAPVTALIFVDQGGPEVGILNPADSTIVTAPTNIIGIASSSLMQSWQVRYRLAPPSDGSTDIPTDNNGWATLATGSTSVVSNTLAMFDPTMLLNGIYQVQVVATDLLGRSAYSEATTLRVDRNLKIGQFTLSFSDLNVPVAGVPIEIVRTYDSRDQRTNDFGVGWSLDIRNVRLQKNRNLGPAWFEDSTGGTFPTYFMESVNDRDLTITLANGREFKFTAQFSPASQLDVPIQSGNVTYKPTADTYATLESVRGDDVEVSGSIPGVVDLFDVQTGGFFNPTLFKLTTEEGEVYLIDENEGLKSLTDRNGNTLLISTNGVLWTNTVTGGASVGVTFVRDPQGRISQIIDPQGNALNYTYGTNGSLATFTDRETNTTTFAYTNLAFPHYLTGITDPRGIQAIRTEYDDSGRMIRQTDGAGNVIEFTHDLSNNREIVRDRLGNVTIHEYDDDGNIIRTTDPLGNVTTSKYDANDNLLEQVDALGNTNSYTYDTKGNKLTETDPLGFTTHYTYGPLRTLTSITNPRGFTTTNSYDPDTGELLQEQDALGNVTGFSYDGNGNLLARTDALGNVMSNLYDSLGHMTNMTVIDAVRGVLNSTSFTYDTNGNQLSKSVTRTTTSGLQVLTTLYTYDKENRLIQTVNPDGSTNATIYTLGLNKPAAEIDALGRRTLLSYDERGNLTNTVYADGASESWRYDAENRKVAMIDRAGRLMTYGFDALARMTNTVFADGAVSNVVYDAIGRVIATVDERGNTTHYAYDPNCGCSGRQAFITNALGQVTHRSYDEDANETSMVDALGRTTTYSYDALDRLTSTHYIDGSFSTTTYDALGRRTAETDQSTNTTQFAYDAAGRLIAVTNALGKATTYAYDEVGSLISQTDANNHTTTFEYDSMGRRTKYTLPLGQIETYQYDLAGELTNRTDFNGHRTGYAYDGLARLLSKTPDAFFAAPTVTFTYTATGQRATMSDAGGATVYRYNSRDWLTNKTWTPAGQASSLSLNYTYNSNGNLATIQSSTAGGTAISYDYDALNRLDGVNDAHVGCCAEYGYDAVGNLQSQTYPNGINTTYQYDLLNRLTNLTTLNGSSALVAKYNYTVAPSGHRLTAAENVVVTNSVRTINRIYTYDATYRLINEEISATGPISLPASANVGYGLDDVGNRLSRTTSGFGSGTLASTSSTYDANDRLTSDTYDANGNTTTGHIPAGGAAVNDKYDFEDHLVNRNNGQITVTYDGDGNRVAKTVGGVTTLFLVDDRNPSGYAQVLEEHVSLNSQPLTLNRAYTYGTDLISEDQWTGTAWTVSFYGHDGHGNVRYLTDTNAAVTDTYDYDAFGTLIAQYGAMPNNYLYCGQQFDADLSLYYNRARYLNVDSGRFWTRDAFEGALRDPVSLHKYLYANSDPINRVDPFGRFSLGDTLLSMSIGATVNVMGTLAGPGFWNKSPAEQLKAIGISAAEGAAFSVIGTPIGNLYLKIFGPEISTLVLRAAVGGTVGFASQVVDQLLDIIINKKPITKQVVLCGSAKVLTATVGGFIMGGLMANANVEEENLINSRTAEVKYEGLTLSLSSFPVSHNAAGIAGMGAGDIVVDLVTDWLTFVGGCKE